LMKNTLCTVGIRFFSKNFIGMLVSPIFAQ
jgi:hypothetical protein